MTFTSWRPTLAMLLGVVGLLGGDSLAQTPYSGVPVAVPGLVEFERYDLGGSAVAYNDLTTGNAGGAFRGDDVDISADASASGGFAVSTAAVGEWLRFTANVSVSAARPFANLTVRYQANYEKQIRILQNGVVIASPVLPAVASGWGNMTVEKVPLVSGTSQNLRVEVVDSGGNALFCDKITAAAAEQWDVLDAGNGTVALRSVLSGKFLRVTSKDHQIYAASAGILGNQEKLEWADLGGGQISFRSINSNTYMSVSNTTSSVAIKSAGVTSNNQRFTADNLGPTPGGTPGTYPVGYRVAIRSVLVSRYLSIANDPNLKLDSFKIDQWFNRFPVVKAGFNRTLAWPSGNVTLSGTAQELDPSGAIATRGWRQISGPSTATLSAPSTSTTSGIETTTLQASSLQPGIYVFEFFATDDMDDRSASRMEVAVIQESQHTLVPPNDSRIQYFGRVHGVGTSTVQFGWSGAGLRLRFEGNSLTLKLAPGSWPSTNQQYYAIIDGDDTNPRVISPLDTETLAHIATGLSPGPHQVEIYSLSGAWVAPGTFSGVLLGPGTTLLSPPVASSRRMEFYGDSITEGGLMPDQELTNTYRAYAATTARKMGADAHIICKSGLGLVKTNNGGGSSLEGLYWRSMPNNSTASFDFNSWIPQVVVINIMQNDKWLQGSTPDQDFIDAYVRFLRLLRAQRPYAHIICTLGSMDATSPGSKWPGFVQTAVNTLLTQDNDAKIHTFFFTYLGSGTGHPSTAQASDMADALKTFIEQLPVNVWESGRPASAGYRAWALTHYPILHASEALPTAPAGRGEATNLQYYAAGLDPADPTQRPMPDWTPDVDSGGFVFRFRAQASELNYQVLMSTNLLNGSWTPVPWPQILESDGWRSVQIPGSYADKMFLQLSVSMP
ncbi:MAG: hypothetical protein SFU85_04960 [Candidatus Methylacidiphilales bacterium]|nr:hypothetical protein [Candidatus Methylacidiphilales bacterium]